MSSWCILSTSNSLDRFGTYFKDTGRDWTPVDSLRLLGDVFWEWMQTLELQNYLSLALFISSDILDLFLNWKKKVIAGRGLLRICIIDFRYATETLPQGKNCQPSGATPSKSFEKFY
jgi:hypothetical protein